MTTDTIRTGWKFLYLRDAGAIESHATPFGWTIGEWAPPITNPQLCHRGYHYSDTIPDALRNVRGTALAQIEARGAEHIDTETHPDKRCAAELRLVRVWRWTKRDSVALAVCAAELVLPVFEERHPVDDRPRKAIEAAKAYVAGHAAASAAADADAAAYAAYAAASAAADAYAAAAADADAAAAASAAADADAAADAYADASAAASAASAAAAAADAYAAASAAADAYAAYAAASAAAYAAADAYAAAQSAIPEARQQIADWCVTHTAEMEEITVAEATS